MITSATPKAEKKQIIQRLYALSERKLGPHEKEIKLAYVTVLIFSSFLPAECGYLTL
jgi:hypothetical protein